MRKDLFSDNSKRVLGTVLVSALILAFFSGLVLMNYLLVQRLNALEQANANNYRVLANMDAFLQQQIQAAQSQQQAPSAPAAQE